ncbi:hypothetical protein [Streptomyces sp. NBC_00388]|uniref:hypothetical protein n=1 Tax=Streptomyces sp. NBC_00388 TaxID=2975735 RepID=UPI003FA6B9D6
MDYGCWSRDERSAIRRLVEAEEACFRMVYLPVGDETQRARIAHRWATAPEETLPMSEADILHGRAHIQEPDAAELGPQGHRPPQGHPWPEDRQPRPRQRTCTGRARLRPPQELADPHQTPHRPGPRRLPPPRRARPDPPRSQPLRDPLSRQSHTANWSVPVPGVPGVPAHLPVTH